MSSFNFDLANITIGADPEIFVGKRNEIVSAHHLSNQLGDKAKPKPTEYGAIQVDGMALEVNVKPSKSKVEFVRNCQQVLQDLDYHLKSCDNEMYLLVRPTAHFTPQYLESLPEHARELGCNPDWDAYDLKENPRPDDKVSFRTAGGHIHIGWGTGFNPTDMAHLITCAEVAKQLDYTIGLASLDFDADPIRRKLYGRAGAFRPKPYGMEYRTMSPMWLHSLQHTGMVYQGSIKALRMLNENQILDEKFEGLARELINGNKREWRSSHPEVEKAIA